MLNWYLQSGENSDVVMSTRIRFARNLQEFKFVNKADDTELNKIIKKMEEITPNIGYGLKMIKMKDIDDITKVSLMEKHIISPDFASNRTNVGAILINEDENICIMINEEDHLRIQVFAPGLDLDHSFNYATEIDKVIENMVNYAYNDKYGFLTACPTNVGTGLRASVMVHLPGLAKTNNIERILEVVNKFGMNIRGVYGEGSDTQGDLYQISNKQSLGITEKEIIENLKLIIEKIIEQERLARKYLTKNKLELEDKLYRTYGVLTNCKKISSKESKQLISNVKLGTDLGIIKELDDLKIAKIALYTKSANLQKYLGRSLNEQERDIERAKVIKQIVNDR